MNYLKFFNIDRTIQKFLTPSGPINYSLGDVLALIDLMDLGMTRELALEEMKRMKFEGSFEQQEAQASVDANQAAVYKKQIAKDKLKDFGNKMAGAGIDAVKASVGLVGAYGGQGGMNGAAAFSNGIDAALQGDTGVAITGMIGGAATTAVNAVDTALMGDKNFSAGSQAIDTAVHGVSGALMKSGNPWAIGAGALLEGLNFVTKAGGQNVLGYDVKINNSGYSTTMAHQDSQAGRIWDKWSGATARKLAKRNEQARMALAAAEISEDTAFEQEARMNSVDDVIQQNEIALQGGIDTSLLAAKHGAKLLRLENQLKKVCPDPELIITHEEIIIDVPEEIHEDAEIIKAKNGAKLEHIEVSEQPSVIPSGAMHKNKNHLDLDITEKGIPVITVEDDSAETFEDIKEQEDTLVQHAEVEEAEIIFNKELTLFLENLRKQWHESDNSNNSICLEAGMRLAKEIVTNTEDNTDVTEKSLKAIENEDN